MEGFPPPYTAPIYRLNEQFIEGKQIHFQSGGFSLSHKVLLSIGSDRSDIDHIPPLASRERRSLCLLYSSYIQGIWGRETHSQNVGLSLHLCTASMYRS